MFPIRQFAARFFAPRYWPIGGISDVGIVSQRYNLIGTSEEKFELDGTSTAKFKLKGPSEEKFALDGS